jgi:hypothetical protein
MSSLSAFKFISLAESVYIYVYVCVFIFIFIVNTFIYDNFFSFGDGHL